MNDLRHWPLVTVAATLVVAGIAVVPRLAGGSWAATGPARAVCPATFSMVNTRTMPVRDGARGRMVPDEPGAAVICRYRANGLRNTGHRFLGSHPLPGPAAYAARLNKLPQPHSNAFMCMYTGETPLDLLLFTYPDGTVQGVWIDHGCSVIGNGRRLATVDRGLEAPLDAQFPTPPTPSPLPYTSIPTAPTPTPSPLTRAQLKTIGCAPDRRPAPAVRPDAGVRAATDAVWARIEAWLKVNAPTTYAGLRPPATPAEIQKAEVALGRAFPDDVVSSLLRHDGVGASRYPFTVPYMFSPLPAARIVSTWKMLCGIVRTMPDLSGTWWHGRLIPIGEDGTGVTLVADPAAHGKVGQADDENGLEFGADTAWPSYLALLQATAHALETGTAVRGWAPEVESGGLDWKLAHPPTKIPTKTP